MGNGTVRRTFSNPGKLFKIQLTGRVRENTTASSPFSSFCLFHDYTFQRCFYGKEQISKTLWSIRVGLAVLERSAVHSGNFRKCSTGVGVEGIHTIPRKMLATELIDSQAVVPVVARRSTAIRTMIACITPQ